MRHVLARYLLPALVVALTAGARSAAAGEEPADKQDEKKAEAPATEAVTPRHFEVTLSKDGTFVPQDEAEVACRPEAYGGGLEVIEAADPGVVVAGQTLVRFDTEALDRDLTRRERDVEIARTKLDRKVAETRKRREDLRIHRRSLELRVRQTIENFERFRELDRPTRIEKSEFSLEGMRNRVQDQIEELEQLRKMYEADDLTEETEGIVLRRAKRGLERSRRSLEFQQQGHEKLIKITLPREEQKHELEVRRRQVELELFEATAEGDMKRAELELENARSDFESQEKKLADLRADRNVLHLRAPIDGIAVTGRFSGGKWHDVGSTRVLLKPGGKPKARQVLFTILRPGMVGVSTALSSAEALEVAPGQRVAVTTSTARGVVLRGVISEVSPVPEGGKHAVRVELGGLRPGALAGGKASPVPGQTCKLKIILRSVDQALTVPAKAVRRDGTTAKVYVWKDEQIVPRVVEVGSTVGGRTEVFDGIEAGEHVLSNPPEGAGK